MRDTEKKDAGDPPLEVAWNAFAGAVAELLENQGKDRVATRIPFEGRVDSPDTRVVSTVTSLLANALLSTLSACTENAISLEDVLSGLDVRNLGRPRPRATFTT